MHQTQPTVSAWKYSPESPDHIRQFDLQPFPVSMDEATRMLPEGIYTTLRTFKGSCILKLDDHLHRLEEGAQLTGFRLRAPRHVVEKMISASLAYFSPADIRLRLILDTSRSPGDIYLAAVRFEPIPTSLYLTGVAVVTADGRRDNPAAKVTSYLTVGSALRKSKGDQAYEVLLVNELGEILEGTSSNFYAVIDGELVTASEGVLPGITRSLVLDEAQLAGLVLHDRGANLGELAILEEAFLSSSTRGIVPIISINTQRIGSGKPGKITHLLMERYRKRLDQVLESLPSSSTSPSSPDFESSTKSPRS